MDSTGASLQRYISTANPSAPRGTDVPIPSESPSAAPRQPIRCAGAPLPAPLANHKAFSTPGLYIDLSKETPLPTELSLSPQRVARKSISVAHNKQHAAVSFREIRHSGVTSMLEKWVLKTLLVLRLSCI